MYVCMDGWTEGLALGFGDVLRDESWGDILYGEFLDYVGGAGAGFVLRYGEGVWCLAKDWGHMLGSGAVYLLRAEEARGTSTYISEEILRVWQRVWGHMPSFGTRKSLGSPGVSCLLGKKTVSRV